MKVVELSKKEMKNTNGGWWNIVVAVAEIIYDTVTNPDDFKKGFKAVTGKRV